MNASHMKEYMRSDKAEMKSNVNESVGKKTEKSGEFLYYFLNVLSIDGRSFLLIEIIRGDV